MSTLKVKLVHPDQVSAGLLDCLEALAPVRLSVGDAFEILCRRHRAGIHTFGAYLDGGLVATATLMLEQKLIRGGGLVGHVEDVAVRPDHQGRGLGKILISHLVAVCKLAGCYKVLLNCDDDNVGFYEKAGFRRHDNGMRLDIA